ncbi:MAG: outer membrane protein assembly factor BamA, partial [Muribaculaceae bacterium]|nr:outer membrane protein assembly factor BamA [Muribaculaceae bacterium]
MRIRHILLAIGLAATATTATAQQVADTVFNPPVIYGTLPRVYEIAGITVTGAPNYDDSTILGYAGLKKGDRMAIPGDDLTAAVKRLMHQGLFAQVQVKVLKTAGDKAWLELALRTQPRISKVNYIGMKKADRDDIQEKLQLLKGNQITQNIVNRAEAIIRQHYKQKGFGNADVKITLHEDLSAPNEMIVDIAVDRHDKLKVHKIYIDGNEVLSDAKIKRTIKKTNEKNDILKIFSQKKFVENDYQDDLNRILEKYNELGYRDARIVSDSIVPYDDKSVDVHIAVDEGRRYYIKDINWVGNTVYPPDVLSTYLDMKPGDVYNQKHMTKRLSTDDDAVSNLYMDRGYLFYDLVPIEREVEGDSISLEMRMIEGPQAR